jgi:hypothetical protein
MQTPAEKLIRRLAADPAFHRQWAACAATEKRAFLKAHGFGDVVAALEGASSKAGSADSRDVASASA